PKLEQPEELLLEEAVVVAELVAEERERLDERAAAGHDLRPAVREQVDGRELLVDADRVVGAEDADGARQADALRARGRGGEDDRGRGDGEVRPVVLADAEDVQPDLVGQLDLLEQVAEALGGAEAGSGELREGVDPELHDTCLLKYSLGDGGRVGGDAEEA